MSAKTMMMVMMSVAVIMPVIVAVVMSVAVVVIMSMLVAVIMSVVMPVIVAVVMSMLVAMPCMLVGWGIHRHQAIELIVLSKGRIIFFKVSKVNNFYPKNYAQI